MVGRGIWAIGRGIGAALLIALAALLAPGTSAAAPWIPAKLSGAGGKVFLLGVSCPSPSLCVASGTNNLIASSTDPTGGSAAWDFVYAGEGPWPQTENWPTEEISGLQVQGISCPSSKLCVAVMNKGNIYSTTNPTGPASAWKAVDVDADGPNTHLYGVSCPSPSLCVAVSGKRADKGKVFTSTDPTGDLDAWRSIELEEPFEFRGISCPSASLCVGVGDDGRIVTSTDPRGDASAWKTIGAPGGPGSLRSVSCAADLLCVSGNQGGNLLTSTNPTAGLSSWGETDGGGSVQITGVSCPSASECLVVDNNGGVLTSTDPTGGRSAWTYENLIPYAPPEGDTFLEGNALFAASCPSSSLCVVTGARGQILANADPFAERDLPDKRKNRARTKRPRAKIATVHLSRLRRTPELSAKLMVRFYAVGRARRFLCKLDRRPIRPCRSPKRYRLGIGKHVFRVRAVGITGLKGPAAREVITVRPPCRFGPAFKRPRHCPGPVGDPPR